MQPLQRRTAHAGILPPHVLEAIARSGNATERRLALETLAIDSGVRSARVARAALAPSLGAGGPHRNRRVYSAGGGSTLPGRLARSEAERPTGDAATDEAYDGLGATFDFYWNVLGRDSVDGAGSTLEATVHFGINYDNAFFNGTEMIFGDGDGRLFNRFTIGVDIVGHELTHAITTREANLVYRDQAGALSESLADVFASLIRQYVHVPQQTAAQADWLIGAGLFTPAVAGAALRSLKAPGTAYDDPVLGRDPQPAHMDGYVVTSGDDGGVHINSGIPNHAFYLCAVAFGGLAWERAGRIWYEALVDDRLVGAASFAAFASLTAEAAARAFGEAERATVLEAWRQVGVAPAPTRRKPPARVVAR